MITNIKIGFEILKEKPSGSIPIIIKAGEKFDIKLKNECINNEDININISLIPLKDYIAVYGFTHNKDKDVSIIDNE